MVSNKKDKSKATSNSVPSEPPPSVSDESKAKAKIEPQSSKLLQLPRAWVVLATLRLLVNIFGQRSYIHPDEFFQGLEVIAGDLFNCQHSTLRPWEFQFQNITDPSTGTHHIQEPIRNIFIPYVFYGLPLTFLKFLNTLFTIRDYSALNNKLDSSMAMTPVQASTLIYYPRVFMTICSLIIDFTVIKSSELFGLDGTSVLLTFATSYISVVYLTRTFSNTIETMLFSVLIFLVIKSIKSQHILNDKFLIATEPGKNSVTTLVASTSDLVNTTFQNAEAKDPKSGAAYASAQKTNATLKRLKLFDIFKYDNLGTWIGLIICIGFFNRPTFLFFAIVPLAYWLLYGLDQSSNYQQFISFVWRRCLTLSRLAVPCLIALVLIDTCYYLELNSLSQVINLVLKRDRQFIMTPYNFFAYNMNPENLKTHGTHPFYLHATINCFVLFGINHFILYLIFFNFFVQIFKALRETQNPDQQTLTKIKRIRTSMLALLQIILNNRFCYLLFSYLVPLVLFSMVSHQEARFLLPLIIPICLLTGHCVFGESSYLPLRVIWLGFNLVAFIFYGYIHQGGVTASLGFVQKMFGHVSNLEMDQHVIYANTYMPPRFLVMTPFSVNIINNKRFLYESNRKRFEAALEDGHFDAKFRSDQAVLPPQRQIYDLMGNLSDLKRLVRQIKANATNASDEKKFKRNLAIFFIAPSVIEPQLDLDYDELDACQKPYGVRPLVTFQRQNSFKLHFSGEHLGEQMALFNCQYDDVRDFELRTCLTDRCKRWSVVQRAFNAFALNFYQVII